MEIALKNAVVPALSTWIGVTPTTPGEDATSFCSVCSRGSLVPLAGVRSDTATISGPFTPGPKFCEIWSYARRAVVDVDSAPTSCWPSVSESNGMISGTRIARPASPANSGCLATGAAHRDHNPPFWCSGSTCRTSRAVMRGPRIASTAGSSVSAASTATTTATAAIRPIVVTSGMPATASDTSATVTVQPANVTAPPEVATARAIASLTGRSAWIPRKWRVTMNRA